MRKYILLIVISLTIAILKTFAANDTLVRLKVERDIFKDELLLRIKYNATDNHDGAYDAFKMFSYAFDDPQIWSVTPLGDELAINTFPFNTSFKSFNIGFKTNVADSFTLTAYSFSKIDTNIRMYLRDLIANQLIDLRRDTVYKFYSGVVNNANRFRFYFAGETTFSNGVLNYGNPDSLISLKILDSTMVIDNSSINAYNVYIEPNAGLTLNSNSTLTVKNNLIIKSDASGDGSFIQNGNLICNGELIAQKYLADLTSSGWYIASPVINSNVNVFDGSNGVWYFDALNAEWVKQTSGSLMPLNGYVTKYAGLNKTANFIGQFNNNVIGCDLVRTADYGGNFGWNLIGNPYPSSINWDLIIPDDKINLNDAIYFRKLNGQVASYVFNAGNNGGTSFIPPMQAFWVQVTMGETYGTIILNNNYRVHSKQQQYKSCNNSTEQLSLFISDNNISDEAIIRLKTNAHLEFDKEYDAVKFFSDDPTHPQIYTITPLNNELSINTLPLLNTASYVNLAFFSPHNNTLKISFQNTQNFNSGYHIYFEDSYTNEIIDVRQENNYSFTTMQGTFNDRFKFHFIPLLNNTPIVKEENSVSVYYYNGFLHFENIPDRENLYFKIYNVLGQCIEKSYILNQSPNYSRSLLLDKGVYYIDLYATDGTFFKQQKFFVP